ncbi:E2-like conjugating enzyme atg10 [Mortierella sp. NVP85]|nr:E2-like conjugating enzyme atg10 [Mortierella sp. NVP85]
MSEDSIPSGRLSYNDFEIAIKAFLKQSEHHAPWGYVEYPGKGRQLQGYLSMTQLVHSQQPLQRPQTAPRSIDTEDQQQLDDLEEHFGEIPDDDDDDGIEPLDLAQEVSHDFLSVSYHIVFSPTYQVPVLYFNAYKPDGQSISLEDIFESLVPEDWRSTIRNAGLNGGISQHDHPILNVPYFYMHPCETVSLMETTFCKQASENSMSFLEGYIASWLSLTGQAIGITLPATLAANNTSSSNID